MTYVEPGLRTLSQAARELNITISTLKEWIADGLVLTTTEGRRETTWIDADEIRRLLDSGRHGYGLKKWRET